MKQALKPVCGAVAWLCGQLDPNFIHMRAITYLASGGPMLTMKVV